MQRFPVELAGRRFIPASMVLLLLTLSAFSSGKGPRLDADPSVTVSLPGQSITIQISRKDASLDEPVPIRFENLSAGIVQIQESAVIPAGEASIEVPLYAIAAGGANVRASADGFAGASFAINVLEAATGSDMVFPPAISLRLAKGQAETVAVSASTPSGSVVPAADVAFALDGRSTHTATVARLAAAFPAFVENLKAEYPGVSFAFSVAKFGDFGGPGRIFAQYAPTAAGAELDRPYVLLLPMTLADSPANIDTIAKAMMITMPGPAYHSIGASSLEALRQVAFGIGFDGDGNGSMLDSGAAGDPGGGSQRGFLSPGPSGDVPPFASKPASIPSAGNLGGVGFRAGAQRIVVMSTNTMPVAPYDRTGPFPALITGANGVTVSSSHFQTVISYPPYGPFANKRFGPVSDSYSAALPADSVAPKGAATLPEVFKELAAQGIQVVNISQATQFRSTPQTIDPQQVLSAISRLTGAVDEFGIPMAYELMGGTVDQVVDTLVLPIRTSVGGSRVVTLRDVGNSTGFGFTFTPESVQVTPGGQAAFDVTLTGTGSSGAFEIHFVTQDGTIIGRIPVTIQTPSPVFTGISPTAGPIGSKVTISGSDFTTGNLPVSVTIGGVPAQILSVTSDAIQVTVPPGLTAGSNPVVAAIGTYQSQPFAFTVTPVISGIAPTSGPGNSGFTLTGTGFSPVAGDNTIIFTDAGGTSAAAEAKSYELTSLSGIVPIGITSGSSSVKVVVRGQESNAVAFTVVPAITSIAPTNAPGGTAFTISGSGFSPNAADNTIQFVDSQTGTITVVAQTSTRINLLTGNIPASMVGGNYNVRVLVRGTASNSVSFMTTPLISVSPAIVALGGQLRITGTGFSQSLSENVVTINGRVYALDPGSSPAALLVTIPAGTTSTSLEVMVTVRGAPSNKQTVTLNPSPSVLSVKAAFQTREVILITVSGSDVNGDVKSMSVVVKDGSGQVLGQFPAISLQSTLQSQTTFAFNLPLYQANHFTAANSVSVQLTDTAGNTSAVVTVPIVNPDIRPGITMLHNGILDPDNKTQLGTASTEAL